jgi:hypothetical protein
MSVDRSKMRAKQRENRIAAAKQRKNEKALDTKNAFGISDLTPKAAVDKIIDKMINGGGQNM